MLNEISLQKKKRKNRLRSSKPHARYILEISIKLLKKKCDVEQFLKMTGQKARHFVNILPNRNCFFSNLILYFRTPVS